MNVKRPGDYALKRGIARLLCLCLLLTLLNVPAQAVPEDVPDTGMDVVETAVTTETAVEAAEPEETGAASLLAEETDTYTFDPAAPVEARFRFSPSLADGQADAPCTFDPSWFFRPARSNYQSGLVRLSIRTAMAAFGTDAVPESDGTADAGTEPVRYLSEEAPDSTSANIVRLMQDLGFSGITADYQNPGLDTIGYAIANRPVSNEAGESARLILIAVRGSGYRQEWASNFTIGSTNEHQGFSEAASMILDTAETYLSDLREDGYSGPVKFWLTGFSRAAAVANMTAQRLTEQADALGFTRDDVFACCFACPRTVILDSADRSAYDNILNIVHYSDFVPKIPLAPWGYDRYGRTYFLPSPELTARYPEAAARMVQSLSAFLGSAEPELNPEAAAQSVGALTHLLGNQGRLTDRFTNAMAVHVGSQSNYEYLVQGAFRDAIEFTGGQDGFGVFFYVVSQLPDFSERYEQTMLPITQNGTQIGLAHTPELYLAWLDALDRADEYTPEGRSRVLVVNGPADVTVLDGNGTAAAQITGSDAADSILPAYVDPDGQKIISIPLDGAFQMELTATESGTVSYQVEETDLETGLTDRLTGYYEIPVEAGEKLTGTADAVAAGSRGTYPLSSAEGTALAPGADVRETVRNCSVSVHVHDLGDAADSGNDGEERGRLGYARGGGLYVPGEYAQVLAMPADEASFFGWYDENGELLCKDLQYRFRVTEDATPIAFFSTADAEDDGYQVSVEQGGGSGTYQPGDTVTITADSAPDGQMFDKWLGTDGLEFTSGDETSPEASFIMPDHDVTLTASFRTRNAQGCYVATSVYGSYDCPEVWTLRRFRDDVLAQTWYGRLFIRCYYAVSPTAVRLFGDNDGFQEFWRSRLDGMVERLQEQGFASTPYEDRNW